MHIYSPSFTKVPKNPQTLDFTGKYNILWSKMWGVHIEFLPKNG